MISSQSTDSWYFRLRFPYARPLLFKHVFSNSYDSILTCLRAMIIPTHAILAVFFRNPCAEAVCVCEGEGLM